MRRSLHVVVVAVVLSVVGASVAPAQSLPNPYRQVEGWAKLPDGREMGAVGKVTMDTDGEHLWAVIRCDVRRVLRLGVPRLGPRPGS